MGRKEEMIALYADELRRKCNLEPDMALLERVVDGCGPAVFAPDGGLIDPEDAADLARARRNFLVRKLTLADGPDLSDAIRAALEMYEAPADAKYRAVLYYMLVVQLDAAQHLP
jgi:hypothetical protein